MDDGIFVGFSVLSSSKTMDAVCFVKCSEAVSSSERAAVYVIYYMLHANKCRIRPLHL